MAEGVTVTKCFTFNSVRDKPILDLLAKQDTRGQSAVVRAALREFLQQEHGSGLGRQEIIDACRQAIRLELKGRLVISEGAPSELNMASPESAAARNLAGLEEELDKW